MIKINNGNSISKIDLQFLVFITLFLSGIILYLAYPGFMSYDSLRMLEEARSRVIGGIFPPMPVYILRFFDITDHGSTVMIFFQNWIFLFFYSLILTAFRFNFFALINSLIFLLLGMPLVLGCMLVLWKDVTMTSLIFYSLAIIFVLDRGYISIKYFYIIKWSSFLVLTIATLIRFNAFSATLIIFIYWIYVFYPKLNNLKKLIIIISIISYILFANILINGYRIPSLEKLETNNNFDVLMSYDIVGISGWSRESLLPIESKSSKNLAKVDILEIDNVYSSLGLVIMSQNISSNFNRLKIYPNQYEREDIFKAWIFAILDHPASYLKYRWDIFSEIIGAKPYETYEPTHFGKIDENNLGLHFTESKVTDFILSYIKFTSGTFMGKPWVVFLITFFIFPFLLFNKFINRKDRVFIKFLGITSICYIAPFYFLAGTGEVRYAFPSVVICMVLITIFIRVSTISMRVK